MLSATVPHHRSTVLTKHIISAETTIARLHDILAQHGLRVEAHMAWEAQADLLEAQDILSGLVAFLGDRAS